MRVRQGRVLVLAGIVMVGMFVFAALPNDLHDGTFLRFWGCMLGFETHREELQDLGERWPPYTLVELDKAPSGSFECIELPTVPSPVICVHDPLEDVFISGSILEGVPWEKAVVDVFQRLLKSHPDLGVIDVGANIGQYTLLSAAMGRPVVALEPYMPHIRMLHTALVLNSLQNKVKLLRNAVSDGRRSAVLHFKKNNMGAIRVVDAEWPPTNLLAESQCWDRTTSEHRVETIYLDDILELISFSSAIMKVDIEGHESRAMLRAGRLLDKINIPYIFMEWEVLTSAVAGIGEEAVQDLVKYMEEHGYNAYSIVGERCNSTLWHAWPNEVIWARRDANHKLIKGYDNGWYKDAVIT